ncbi:MAG TPA: L-seryl-tRNA(Sec) selenium transferase [Thermoanaerobaculia bacterium]|jgi:L-seryl-tRNA(Ser) seleniumtransferase|nr:L-seryl-tRNA(Sec) selenium transferase [Thermoanaerobaculia bacterium]
MPSQQAADPRRRLPSVDRLLASPEVQRLVGLYGRAVVTVQARAALQALRDETAADGGVDAAAVEALPARVRELVEAALGPPLRRVLNATGVLLHTNLGRAPMPPEVAVTLPALLDAACDLEMELDSGRRGDRNRRAERLLRLLTGAEAALVANNNAAALVLAVATLAAGGEVVVSRGELVEIGGSFRIPEILAAAGARLVEVGTTNKTRLDDYRRAVGPATRLLLKVHPSNYKIVGFTAGVTPAALAGLARERELPLVIDEGAGLLRPRREPQLADHASIAELLAAGAHLVCGSGDKLLGGPQAGLLLGEAQLVARCRKHPLYRALRPSRLAYAALDGVLRRHAAGAPLPLDGLWPDAAAHRGRVAAVAAAVGGDVVTADAFLGGGAAPEAPIPGDVVALPGDAELLARLRLGGTNGEPPVVGYIHEGRLLLDLRTVAPADDALLVAAVRAARAGGAPTPGSAAAER